MSTLVKHHRHQHQGQQKEIQHCVVCAVDLAFVNVVFGIGHVTLEVGVLQLQLAHGGVGERRRKFRYVGLLWVSVKFLRIWSRNTHQCSYDEWKSCGDIIKPQVIRCSNPTPNLHAQNQNRSVHSDGDRRV